MLELLNSTNYSKPIKKKLKLTKEIADLAYDMHKAETSLKEFVKQAWHVVEPKREFKDGWHLDAICDHLMAVSNNQIQNLLINIPPRHMKSLAVSVFFPCWEWITRPELRYVYSSYAESLSKRDSVKCRRLIQSLWYQERWYDKFQISSDQNEKMRFENTESGVRVATSVGGMGTGEGGDRIMVDDAHKITEGESPIKRMSVLDWWADEMSTRLNDEDTGAKVITMQRIHQNDLAGFVLANEHGYTELILPARYEGENRISSVVVNSEGLPWTDPRTKVGEPLWKNRFGIKQLDKRESKMSSYAIAGQQQQRPAPRGGGMFKVDLIKIVDKVNPYHIVKSIRYWDKAGTKDEGKRTAGVLMHLMKDKSVVVEHCKTGQWEAPKRERVIKQHAGIDGIKVSIIHEQEGGSGGKESAQATNRNLLGYKVSADHPTGQKEVRAEAYATAVDNGFVSLVKGKWNTEYLEELEMFPSGTFMDMVDASSGAFNNLTKPKKKVGTFRKR